jgi:S1-C subfamily serine protease
VLQKIPPLSQAPPTVFSGNCNQVLQIELRPRGGGGNSATGTGFIVRHDGLALTNYHVVSNAVLEPDLYLLEYQAPGGQRGKIKVVAIDVINDIALVRLPEKNLLPLSFFKDTLAKGDHGYSLGYPLNQGLTVVEGTYNGISENYY